MKKFFTGNGNTLVDPNKVQESWLKENWDVIVNNMDDEAREKAYQRYMDRNEFLSIIFLDDNPSSYDYEDLKAFLAYYLEVAPCDLIIG